MGLIVSDVSQIDVDLPEDELHVLQPLEGEVPAEDGSRGALQRPLVGIVLLKFLIERIGN